MNRKSLLDSLPTDLSTVLSAVALAKVEALAKDEALREGGWILYSVLMKNRKDIYKLTGMVKAAG